MTRVGSWFPQLPLVWIMVLWLANFRKKKTHGAEYPTKDIPETPQLKNDMNTPEAPRSLIRCLGEARTRDSVVIPTELRDILKTGLWTLHRIFRVWDICWLRVWSEVVFRNTFYISLEGSRDHACPYGMYEIVLKGPLSGWHWGKFAFIWVLGPNTYPRTCYTRKKPFCC